MINFMFNPAVIYNVSQPFIVYGILITFQRELVVDKAMLLVWAILHLGAGVILQGKFCHRVARDLNKPECLVRLNIQTVLIIDAIIMAMLTGEILDYFKDTLDLRLGVLFIPAIIWSVATLLRIQHAARVNAGAICDRCMYPVDRKIKQDKCPECGKLFDLEHLQALWGQTRALK